MQHKYTIKQANKSFQQVCVYFLQGGADLVSCGGSGTVHFWNTVNAQLVGKFVAHEDSNSIIMTVDGSGCYLVTADTSGVLKVWDIQVRALPRTVLFYEISNANRGH